LADVENLPEAWTKCKNMQVTVAGMTYVPRS